MEKKLRQQKFDLNDFLVQMQPISRSSHSRFAKPSMATTKLARAGHMALEATLKSIKAL